MKIVTAEMIRDLDRRAMTEAGMPGSVLMENAGRAVAEFVQTRFSPVANRDIHIACGTGNNGGDGFVAARHLLLSGACVTISVIGDPGRMGGDARIHYDILRRMGVQPLTDARPVGAVKIDALLGTGLEGRPRADIATAIDILNASSGPTISVDVPSGVDSDSGAAPGSAVRAEATVTFGFPKLGLFLGKGADLCGEIVVDPIGFGWESLGPETPYAWLQHSEMRSLIPARPREGHKGTFGHVLIIGGSVGMSGAPIMTARGAMRSGSGLVTAAVPTSIQPIVAASTDELMTIPLPDDKGVLAKEADAAVLEFAGRCEVVCLGPGLRVTDGTRALVERLIPGMTVPLVLDADGLNALATDPSLFARRTAPTILTPHPGECARLLGRTVAEVQADRVGAVRDTARKFRSVVVLKGARSLICDGRGNAEPPIGINTTGNAGMATGGSGDTLTGIIGSLVGQGLDAWDAARLGVFVHARAGDLAAAQLGTHGLMAGDIAERVPAALASLAGEELG